MTMITPSYLGETIEYSSLHACRSTLEDPTWSLPGERELGSHPYYAQWRDHEVTRLRERLAQEIDSLMSELAGVPDVELVLEHGSPCEVLNAYIKRHTPDLVVIGSRDQPHHASQLTDMLLSEPHCDVMLCRA